MQKSRELRLTPNATAAPPSLLSRRRRPERFPRRPEPKASPHLSRAHPTPHRTVMTTPLAVESAASRTTVDPPAPLRARVNDLFRRNRRRRRTRAEIATGRRFSSARTRNTTCRTRGCARDVPTRAGNRPRSRMYRWIWTRRGSGWRVHTGCGTWRRSSCECACFRIRPTRSPSITTPFERCPGTSGG